MNHLPSFILIVAGLSLIALAFDEEMMGYQNLKWYERMELVLLGLLFIVFAAGLFVFGH